MSGAVFYDQARKQVLPTASRPSVFCDHAPCNAEEPRKWRLGSFYAPQKSSTIAP